MNQPANPFENVLATAREVAREQTRSSEAAHALRNQQYAQEMRQLDNHEKNRRSRSKYHEF